MATFAKCLGILLAAAAVCAPAAAEDLELDWSSTFELRLYDFRAPADEDERTGFFDRYQFTRNKFDEPTVEFALRDLSLDLLGEGDTPRLQFRLSSPTSDFNLSGGTFEIAELLLNQRAELLVRPGGLALDLDYRRLRTEELRLFRNGGFGSQIAEAPSAADDRYFMRRSRVGGELRLRPELLGGERGGFLSEVALRGAYEERKGKRQIRRGFLSEGTQRLDQEVTDGGAGLVFHPGGLFTLAVDFDHQRFREDAPTILQGAAPQGTIHFIPDTDRTTGTVRLHSRIGERAVLHGGLQVSSLNQEEDRTPRAVAAGLRANKVLFYSGNLAADVALLGPFSLNAFFKFDHRSNKIERDTALFNPLDGSQEDVFLDRVRRIRSGAELVLRPARRNRISLGVRWEDVDRDLDFALPTNPTTGGTNQVILEQDAWIGEDTRILTGYLGTTLRPLPGLHVVGEVGYRDALDTGYLIDLDDVLYGDLRASWTLPLTRPVTLTVFARGESGENDDFTAVSRDFAGAVTGTTDRDYERDRFSYGATLTVSPWDRVALFTSIFHHEDASDYDLLTSSAPRYIAPLAGITFAPPVGCFSGAPGLRCPLDYRGDVSSLIAGGTLGLTERTELGLSYSFTRSNARLQSDNVATNTIDQLSRVRSDIHSGQVELGHWLRDGLRVHAGYRIDHYRDRTRIPTAGGVARPFDLSTNRHTVTLGVTLNDDLLR